jgi:hypothetical protein
VIATVLPGRDRLDTHPVTLRAPSFLGGGDAPVVLRLNDQRFVPTLFADLKDPARRAALVDKRIPADDPTLYLPVHRTFNLILAEAVCDVPGKPRLDPARIDSAGVVIRRRVPRRPTGRTGPQRWVRHGESVMGWQSVAAQHADDDPDAARRPRLAAGNAAIEAALARRRPAAAQVSEVVTRMYVAPPDVCAAVGATLLFGVVEAASPERAERPRRAAPAAGPAPAETAADPEGDAPPTYTSTEIRSMVPAWLLARATPAPIPAELAGRTFRVHDAGGVDLLKLEIQYDDAGTWRRLDVPSPWTPMGASLQGSSLTDLRHFLRMLSQLQLQWDVWGSGGSALKATLQGTAATLPDGSTPTLDTLLRAAAAVFVLQEEDATVTFPTVWPLVGSQAATAVQAGIQTALEARLEQFVRHEGRFDRPEGRYHLRAFARVRRDDGCPPALFWSGATPEYRVARWFEGAPEGAVIPTIELPTIDRGFLKNLRPNVTLKVPRSLFNFLQNNAPEEFLGGEARNDTSGPAFMWICGFNISIIFMIAFMLLITFVFLLNIVFWWVAFFRICIPLPGGLFDDGEG